MAIKNRTTEELVNEFIEKSVFLKEYESTERIINNEEHSYNIAKKCASTVSKCAKLLLSTEVGTLELIKLLDSEDIAIAVSSAEYLYPLYPDRCLEILTIYSKSLKNKLDSYKVDCKIEGLKNHEPFFMDTYKKLYGCNDLDLLNREKEL